MTWIIFILLILFIFGVGGEVVRNDQRNFEQVKREIELMNYLKGLDK